MKNKTPQRSRLFYGLLCISFFLVFSFFPKSAKGFNPVWNGENILLYYKLSNFHDEKGNFNLIGGYYYNFVEGFFGDSLLVENEGGLSGSPANNGMVWTHDAPAGDIELNAGSYTNNKIGISFHFLATTSPSIKGAFFSLNHGWSGSYNGGMDILASGNIRFYFYSAYGGGSWAVWTSNDDVSFDSEWKNVIIQAEFNSQMSSNFKLYIDGSEWAGSWNDTDKANAGLYTDSGDVSLRIGGQVGGTYGFKGKIDDFIIKKDDFFDESERFLLLYYEGGYGGKEYTPPIDLDFEDRYYDTGGYFVPRNIDCYSDLDSCDMIFSYTSDVGVRSLASSSPDLPEYPNFRWWWPNVFGEMIISTTTIRQYIDQGFQSYVLFRFPTPTTTTSYVLDIQDIDNPDSVQFYFVVNANKIGSTTEEKLMSTCLGTCDETFLGSIFCGFKMLICWAFVPGDTGTLAVKSSWENLQGEFPFSIPYDLINSIKAGFENQGTTTAFKIPMISQTAEKKRIWIDVITASTSENIIGSSTYDMIQTTIGYIYYLIFAGGIIAFVIKNK